MSEIQQDILNDFIELPKPTSIGKRIGATLIDSIVLWIIFAVIGMFWGEHHRETTTSTITTTSEGGVPRTTHEVSTSDSIVLNGTGNLIFLACWFLVMVFLEGRSGQTVGKRVVRIKVIRVNGEPSNVGTSFLRHLFDIVDWIFFIGIIVAASNPRRMRIGDKVAGTYVVDKV